MDDSSMSEDDGLNCLLLSVAGTNTSENAKRLKTELDSLGKSDESNSKESTSSSSTTENDKTASTSTNDSGFPKHRNTRNRNYRKSRDEDSSANDSDQNTEPNTPADNQQENQLSDSPDNSTASESSSNFASHHETDSDDDVDAPVLKKQPPKHNWFVLSEVINRQIGHSSKQQGSDLFQRRCYGSLHSVQRLELMYKMEKHEGCVNSLNFHPDGSLLASGSDDLNVVIWDWKVGRSLLSYETKHRGNVFQSKFLPLSGDLHVATCARDGQVRLAQISRQEGLRSTRKLGSHHGPCHKLATLLDQPHIVLSAGEDGYVLNHDVRNPKCSKIVHVLQNDHEVDLYSISAHPLKSHEFCVSGRDNIVRVYDQRRCSSIRSSPLYTLYSDKQKYTYELHVTCALYNYNGSEILASYNDDSLYLFDVQGTPGTFVHQYQGHRNTATIKGVNFFGPKSEFIVSGSDCGHIYFWDRNTEAIVQWLLADNDGVVNCLEPHPQLPFICTSGLDWDVKVWVPSCEHAPSLAGLADTVNDNYKHKANISENGIHESQMLFTLWRYLRTSSRMQRVMNNGSGENDVPSSSSSSRSSNSGSYSGDMGDDDDDLYRPPGCTPS